MSRFSQFITGRPITAQEAFNIGLTNRIGDLGKSRQESENLAREIAVFP